MEIKVTVTGLEGLADSIALLAAAMGGKSSAPISFKKGTEETPAPKEETPAPKEEKPKTQKSTPAKDKPKTEPAPSPEEEPAADQTPETEPEVTPEPETKGKGYTLEEVRTKLASLSKAGHAAEVKAIIVKNGADKLTELDESTYPAVMKAAEALEAKIKKSLEAGE